jgi:hypothetical protein
MIERTGVIPAQAGAFGLRSESTVVAAWIPACAGMTGWDLVNSL